VHGLGGLGRAGTEETAQQHGEEHSEAARSQR
jgi:hypothetical protein